MRAKVKLFLCGLFITLIFVSRGWAQVDPTSALLVKPSNSASGSSGLDSGRYTVKPLTNAATEERKASTATGSAAPKAAKTENQIKQDENKDSKNKVVDDKKNTTKGIDGEVFMHEDSGGYGGDSEDGRQNIVEVSVAPGFLYVDSSSQYWFRKYSSSGPSLAVKADIWGTPSAGFYVNYFTTLAAGLTSSPNTEKTILVDHRFTDVGLQFRKYANFSRMSPYMIFGIGYAEYQMIIPAREQNRTRVKSAGLSVSLQAKLPRSLVHKNAFGIELMPKQNITEQKSAVNVKSGTRPSSYAIRFLVGQEYTFDHSNQIFWNLTYRHEQTIYGGSANVNDPIDGTKPEGVSVRSGMTLIEVGYTWGE